METERPTLSLQKPLYSVPEGFFCVVRQPYYPWGPNKTPLGAVPDQSRGFGHTAPTCTLQATEDFVAPANMGAFHLIFGS